MKPVLILILLACVGFGLYSWNQKQQAYQWLKSLQETDVNIDFTIDSRPIIAVNKADQILYLAGLGKVQKIIFSQVDKIELWEAIEKGNNASEPIGPDYAFIMLHNGEKIRVGDLSQSVTETAEIFRKYAIFSNQIRIIRRK